MITVEVNGIGIDQIKSFPSSSKVHSQICGQNGILNACYDPFEFVLNK